MFSFQSQVVIKKFKGDYCNKSVEKNNFQPYIINENDYNKWKNNQKKLDKKYKNFIETINK